jgi:hypothetical protein
MAENRLHGDKLLATESSGQCASALASPYQTRPFRSAFGFSPYTENRVRPDLMIRHLGVKCGDAKLQMPDATVLIARKVYEEDHF